MEIKKKILVQVDDIGKLSNVNFKKNISLEKTHFVRLQKMSYLEYMICFC